MKLVWTDPSIEDLRSIRDYIARDSEHYAAAQSAIINRKSAIP